jgi:hypothetical protein
VIAARPPLLAAKSASRVANRSFRLVDEETFVPPLRVTVEARGHSLAPPTEHFVATPQWQPAVVFPAAVPGARAYQCIPLHNPCVPSARRCRCPELTARSSSTPLTFVFSRPGGAESAGGTAAAAGVFDMWPKAGIVRPGATQLLAVEFAPTRPGSFHGSFAGFFNYQSRCVHGVCAERGH